MNQPPPTDDLKEMGLALPSYPTPKDQARALIVRKENIEAAIESQLSILVANNSTLRSPLVDAEGFPRADIDVYAVRGARVRILELRNDLDTVVDAIGKALEGVYDPTLSTVSDLDSSSSSGTAALRPFAKINAVAPGSPAAEAGLLREDLLVKFGHLSSQTLESAALQPLVDLVAQNENRSVPIRVTRAGNNVFLTLIPRQNWGGRGMLGCHIVPYSDP